MSYRRDIAIRISGGEQTVAAEIKVVGQQPTSRSVVIPAGKDRRVEVKLPVDVKSLEMVAIVATADVKIEAGGGKDAAPIELTAGRLLLWMEGCGYDRPIRSQRMAFEAEPVQDAEGKERDVTIGIHLL